MIKVAIARAVVAKRTPYFAAALLGFCYDETDEIPTTAVTPRGRILINPGFFNDLSPGQAAFVLVHEYLHVVQRVFDRCGDRDPMLFNLAADMAINPLIFAMGFDAPAGDKAPVMPKKYGFLEGLVAEEYYRLLLEKCQKEGQNKPKVGQGVGQGQCSHGHDKGDKETGGSHPDDRTPAQIERMVRGVAEAVNEAAQKGRGTVPEGLQRWAAGELKPAKVPWRQVLAHAVRRAVATRPGATVRKYDAPSRRQAALGYGEGAPILSRWRKTVPNVVCAIDTSGSMSEQDLQDGLAEIQGVLKALGAAVTFLTCDADVHGVSKISKVQDAIAQLKGGGGTSFQPIFDACAQMRPKPSILILCSDGLGDNPTPIDWARVLMVLVGGNKTSSIDWCEVIHACDS